MPAEEGGKRAETYAPGKMVPEISFRTPFKERRYGIKQRKRQNPLGGFTWSKVPLASASAAASSASVHPDDDPPDPLDAPSAFDGQRNGGGSGGRWIFGASDFKDKDGGESGQRNGGGIGGHSIFRVGALGEGGNSSISVTGVQVQPCHDG